jgi:LemA protein
MSEPQTIIVVGGLITAFWFAVTHNRFVTLRLHLRESWADIDVELKRRHELIPNLVAVVQGYAQHERELFASIARLRNAALARGGTSQQRSADEDRLCLGLRDVFALAESYPALQADQHFVALERALAEAEDRIAAARRLYNGNVRDLNRLRDQFPTNLVARAFNIEPADYFELSNVAERVVPRVRVG